MNQDTVKIKLSPEENTVHHPLDEIVRQGARNMLQKALEVEVDLFLEKYQYVLDNAGSRQIVRNEIGRAHV